MNVDRLSPALIVILGVLAISATAASMDSTATTAQIGAGGGSGAGSGDAAGTGYSDSPIAVLPAETPGAHLDVFNWLRLFLAVVCSGGALAYAAYVGYELWHYGIDGIRTLFVHAITTAIPVVIAGMALLGPHLLLMGGSTAPPDRSQTPRLTQGGGSASAPTAVDPTAQLLPLLALVVGVALAVGLVALVLTGFFESDADEERARTADGVDDDPETAERSQFGRRYRLDDAAASNAVYRAWRDLATAVEDVDGRTETPTEVAARAVENGFDRQAVRTLTDLFEEVRYGQCPPTSDREAAARSALDRLQSEGENA